MFIICSLIRIRASWEKFVFSLYTFCPKGLSRCSSKTRAEYLHGSLWVWFCVDICLVSQFPGGGGRSYFLVSLLLDRSMSSESWCLAGIHQSPCSSDFAALNTTAHSVCSSWQQEHHLPRFSLQRWSLFPELLKPGTIGVHRGSSRASGRSQFSALLMFEASWKLRPCGPCKSLTWKSESRMFQ